MIEDVRVKEILYGGDYNPEQWPEEGWEEDMRLLKKAHINIVTLNVFSWALLQPDEDTYDFSKLDKIMDLVQKYDMKICMATSTGAHPAWMARKYPDVLRVLDNGMRRKYGRRHNSCVNSPNYQRFAIALVEKIAQRYGRCKNIVSWHVSNEYGGICYCENCEKEFRKWLQEKYGTIEEVNRAWNMNFWSHTLYDWEDIVAPSLISEEFESDGIRTAFQGISLDYARFNSDSMLQMFNREKEILNKYSPGVPVTTNFMGMFKPLDYQKWGKSLDFIGWDNYPASHEKPEDIAIKHDLMRGLKQGKPFALMEQTPSVNNWDPICKVKRPGVMRLMSYQAMAHGADTVMFFQMKRSRGACEKFHGAVIDHVGHENTRVFREVATLGAELEEKVKGLTLGGRINAQVAIVFDWDNWWATEYSAGPSRLLSYCEEVKQYYNALYKMNYPVDMVSMDDDLSSYQLVIAPLLYMCKEGYAEKVEKYVEKGGTFMTTYFSGYVDEHDLVVTSGYPGELRKLLGIWVEEMDALPKEEENSFVYQGKRYPARLVCDIMHLEGAEAISCYEQDFYANMPVLTQKKAGEGNAYYVGTRSNPEFYQKFLQDICDELQIEPVVKGLEGVEATVRSNDKGEFLFLLNYTDEKKQILMKKEGKELLTEMDYKKGDILELLGKEVAIVQRK